MIGAGALDDLGRQRSAWSLADVQAAVDRRLAQTWLISDVGVAELRTAAIDTAMQRSVSFLDHGVNVEGVRHYTSDQVLATDQQLTDALTARAVVPGEAGTVAAQREGFILSAEQQTAAEAIAGTHSLVVIQGAAGAGKTTMVMSLMDIAKQLGVKLIKPASDAALSHYVANAGAKYCDIDKVWKPKDVPDSLFEIVDEAGISRGIDKRRDRKSVV